MTNNNYIRVSIYVPPTLYDKIKIRANKRLLSINKWIINRLEIDTSPHTKKPSIINPNASGEV